MTILDREKLIQTADQIPRLYGGLKITNRINEQLENDSTDQTGLLQELLFSKQERSIGTVIELIYDSYILFYDKAASKQLVLELTKLTSHIIDGKDASSPVLIRMEIFLRELCDYYKVRSLSDRNVSRESKELANDIQHSAIFIEDVPAVNRLVKNELKKQQSKGDESQQLITAQKSMESIKILARFRLVTDELYQALHSFLESLIKIQLESRTSRSVCSHQLVHYIKNVAVRTALDHQEIMMGNLEKLHEEIMALVSKEEKPEF